MTYIPKPGEKPWNKTPLNDDQRAFVERNVKAAYRLAYEYCNRYPLEDECDVVSELMWVLLRAARGYKPDRKVHEVTYLYTALKRGLTRRTELADYKYRRQTYSLDYHHPGSPFGPDIPTTEASLEVRAQQHETHDILRDAINLLDQPDRELLDLLYLQGVHRNHAEEILGVRGETIRMRKHRALKKLRDILFVMGYPTITNLLPEEP